MNFLKHEAKGGGFVREFFLQGQDPTGTSDEEIGEGINNRLLLVRVGNNNPVNFNYRYDSNGNMTRETSSRHYDWNHNDQLHSFRQQPNECSDTTLEARYLYDASGLRVKKILKTGNKLSSTHYLDGIFEHHFRDEEQGNSIHIMDDQQRIAIKKVSPFEDDQSPLIQYHSGDHLGSSSVVIGKEGKLINIEEYFPYGETSFGGLAKKAISVFGKGEG